MQSLFQASLENTIMMLKLQFLLLFFVTVTNAAVDKAKVDAVTAAAICVCEEGTKDGVLTLEEFTSGACDVHLDYVCGVRPDANLFNTADVDKNGKLSKTEVSHGLAECLAKTGGTPVGQSDTDWTTEKVDDQYTSGIRYFDCTCDSNNDSRVTWAEVQAEHCRNAQDFATGMHFNRADFEFIDYNSDGSIDTSEIKKVLAQLYYKDGFVTK